jgi:small subunit ribosomal protein S6
LLMPLLCLPAEPLVQREEVSDLRKYEVLYIMRPDIPEEKYKEYVEKYNTLIQENGGEVLNVDIWGKRRLAYEIEKVREGYYILLQMQCDTALPKELERNFKISEEVIRYLITRIGE